MSGRDMRTRKRSSSVVWLSFNGTRREDLIIDPFALQLAPIDFFLRSHLIYLFHLPIYVPHPYPPPGASKRTEQRAGYYRNRETSKRLT